MKTSPQIRVSLPPVLHDKLEAYAKSTGLQIGEIIRHLIATHIKVDAKEMESAANERARIAKEADAAEFQEQIRKAKERSKAKQATTDDDLDALLADVPEPEQAWIPDEAEMQRRRKALLDAFE